MPTEMTVIDHLEELRQRILISLAAIAVVTVVAFFFSDQILDLLLIPSQGLQLTAFNLMDGFMIRFHISLYIGAAAAFPIWGFHIYRFFSPALLENERRAILPALIFSSFLFALGVAFGYYFLPEIIKIFRGVYPAQVTYLAAAQDYISFVLFFLVTCGLAFQLPILLTILIQLRIVSVGMLQQQRRIAYFVLFVIAQLVTPVADPFLAPMIVFVPLIILYEISILAGRRIESQRLKGELENQKKLAEETSEVFETPRAEPQVATARGYCTQCGTPIRTLDARYCDHCGSPLEEAIPLA